ncbi:MoaD/ThiS family protein [Mucilaginibacter conchicola]|uniref:Molybdopterin synthase sulfur carrier subunit n=1 Tax=Mucilaginibacter conchicola TaxID=2303333 RepID=A0A372NX31_9SPHI|nr:MoaD/ThiS family protein [Mucilaginibacter conchicola]RFZ94097.1 MoaD/ThiS family protein [Mucilaginibacter conchicola]
MKVTVLAFGIAKDIFGASSVEVEIPGDTTAARLKAVLEQNYPRLSKLASYMLAVNNEYAGDDMHIKTGDEIALIPPVSGG